MISSWTKAIRIHTLPVGASPVILGLGLAYSQQQYLNSTLAVLTLITCLLLQAGSNLVNDYYDGIRGTDTDQRIGFERVVASGIIGPKTIKKVFILFFLIAFILGLFISYKTGLPILITGLVSIFFALIYTAGPFPLSHYALGELSAFIFFGPVAVIGTYYIQLQNINIDIVLPSLIPGLFAAAIMAINNLRDREQDQSVGKKTMANLMSEQAARYLVLIFIICANAILLYLSLKSSFILIATTPFFIFLKTWNHIITMPIDHRLNNCLKITGKYLTLTCLLLTGLIQL